MRKPNNYYITIFLGGVVGVAVGTVVCFVIIPLLVAGLP